jgi:micrococcal nuclease
VSLLLLVAVAAARTEQAKGHKARGGTVAYVNDGDTIVLTGGERVRLVQSDTPELGYGGCYSRRAAQATRALLPRGSFVSLQADPRLDSVDRYGRLLRYVFRGGLNVNVELVRRGAATVWFYGGVRGIYAKALLSASRGARETRTGLWGACRAIWNPYLPATTDAKTAARAGSGRCDPSYSTACIPSPPPDLDCADIRYSHFRVVGADPHRFDGNHDGIGCE